MVDLEVLSMCSNVSHLISVLGQWNRTLFEFFCLKYKNISDHLGMLFNDDVGDGYVLEDLEG